jgi:hypothetical protein
MKRSLYLESTIPSYLVAAPSRDLLIAAHQQVTAEWWATRRIEFDLYISQFVLDEIGRGDAQVAKRRLNVVECGVFRAQSFALQRNWWEILMAKDPIIDEIRRHRQEIAEQFGYDLRAIIADARQRQKGRGKKVVSLVRARKKATRDWSLEWETHRKGDR